MPGIDATRTHGAHPFGMADDELVEEAVNSVHEEHEGKGQHKEHAENNQRAVMSELVERSVVLTLAVCSAVATTRSLVHL